jgi:hypothetical protein
MLQEEAEKIFHASNSEPKTGAASAAGPIKLIGLRPIAICALAAWALLVVLLDLRRGAFTEVEGIIILSVFAGGIVSGLAGFAFSAIAGSFMLHWVTPLQMVPLLMACSIMTQLLSIASLRHSIAWRRFFALSCGGIAGIPLGALLLEHVNTRTFAIGFGVALILYSAIMLARPFACLRNRGAIADLAVGLAGGVTGGSIAFPGAFPSLWYCLEGVSKETQRGAIQPFILVMQFATMLYFSKLGLLSVDMVGIFGRCVPAVLVGTLIGLALFRTVDDTFFRRIVLFFLLLSGIVLTL